MGVTSEPKAKLKVSVASLALGLEVLEYFSVGKGKAELGPFPGDQRVEKANGRTMIAIRLACGGVSVRETNVGAPSTKEDGND
jgi:hypothetical protein